MFGGEFLLGKSIGGGYVNVELLDEVEPAGFAVVDKRGAEEVEVRCVGPLALAGQRTNL